MKTVTATPIPKKRNLFKRVFLVIILLILVFGVGVAGAFVWYQDAINIAPTTQADPKQNLIVNEGQSLLDIADELRQLGVLKSVEALRVYLRLESRSVNLQKGKYVIPSNLNVSQLLDLLAKGPTIKTVTIRLAEGTRYDEMAQRINTALIGIEDKRFNVDEFNQIAANPDAYQFSGVVKPYLETVKPAGKSLEGFLHPDTYNIASDADAQDVIELLITTQIKRFIENDIDYRTAKGRLGSFYEVLTMASIVEREGRGADERKMVADIFLRRKARGEMLGADAPLLYPFKNWNHQLTVSQINNAGEPYNTRARVGLPPTPICNSNINSIIAVLNPTANDYNYFIHDAQGKVYYAKTLSEHNANIRRYL